MQSTLGILTGITLGIIMGVAVTGCGGIESGTERVPEELRGLPESHAHQVGDEQYITLNELKHVERELIVIRQCDLNSLNGKRTFTQNHRKEYGWWLTVNDPIREFNPRIRPLVRDDATLEIIGDFHGAEPGPVATLEKCSNGKWLINFWQRIDNNDQWVKTLMTCAKLLTAEAHAD